MSSLHNLARRFAPRIPPSVHRLLRFRDEDRFVRGRLVPEVQRPSVLFFTTRKCASTFMARLLPMLNRRKLGLLHLDLEAYTWETRQERVVDFLHDNANALFIDRGVFYGPLRAFVATPHLALAHRLAMLRDPRDVIVSDYYSVRFSHRAPASRSRSRDQSVRRQGVAQMSIDDYAIAAAPYYLQVFEDYRRNLPRSCVLRYEDMWTDFGTWLTNLGALMGVELGADDRAKAEALFCRGQSTGEKQTAHRRKGAPGDHVEKLSPEVVRELTNRFSAVLDWLDSERPAGVSSISI